MYIFGSENIFQIQYDFLEERECEGNSFSGTFGEFRLYVSGNDLCEYTKNGVSCHYQDHLYWITEWLCRHMVYIVGHDPFPVSVSGSNTLELLKNTDVLKFEIEVKDEDEMLLINQAQFEWSFRHGWFASRGGSILPLVFFRRSGDYIEIAWDSTFWIENGVSYKNPVGFNLIQIDVFKQVVLGFLKDYLKAWEANALKYNNPINVLTEWYECLYVFGISRER